MSKNIITIEPSVIRDIIIESLSKIDGVKGIDERSSFNSEITKIFKSTKNDSKLIDIEMGEKECVISLSLILYYGYNIKEITDKVIESINNEIKTITEYDVREINLKVTKLVTKECKKEKCTTVDTEEKEVEPAEIVEEEVK